MKGVRLSLRGLTENWKLKLAALGLAVLLWAVVSAEQVTTQWVPVRVEPVVRDPEYVLTGAPDPAQVRVRFTGPGRDLWELALDRPVLELPVRDVGEGRTFALDPQMVRLPGGVDVRAQDVRPAVVRLGLERLVSKEVPVRVRIGAGSRARYLVDGVSVLPPTVRLTGPAATLARVRAVATRPFEIVPDDSTFTRRIGLDTAGLGGVTLGRPEVRVAGRVDRRVERVLPGVPVETPPGLRVTPRAVEVHVQGGERALAAFVGGAVRVVVVRDSVPAAVPPAGIDVPVRLEGLPPGVGGRSVPVRVHVTPDGAPRPR
ncbi:MAG TPA: hypothetical protein VFX98_16430 [Longimicrobiaceae bacterium]|nr:hypothetical protein [Longimicrobiaceae bacterium]